MHFNGMTALEGFDKIDVILKLPVIECISMLESCSELLTAASRPSCDWQSKLVQHGPATVFEQIPADLANQGHYRSPPPLEEIGKLQFFMSSVTDDDKLLQLPTHGLFQVGAVLLHLDHVEIAIEVVSSTSDKVWCAIVSTSWLSLVRTVISYLERFEAAHENEPRLCA